VARCVLDIFPLVAHVGALKYHFTLPEIGKDIMVIGDFVTPRRFAEVLSTALGKTISLHETTLEEFTALDRLEPKTPQEVVVYELHTMFRYTYTGTCWAILADLCQSREMFRPSQKPNTPYDLAASREVYPEQHDLKGWVQGNQSFKEWAAKLAVSTA